MEMVPSAFPAWFPPSGADQASTRALWLALMGWVQVAIALGFLVQMRMVPAVARFLAFVSGAQPIALPLPNARGAAPRA